MASGPHLSFAQTARKLGVSGKALRIYEAHGLITPARTAAGWRVYGPEEIARLHQILALKSFGFSLGRIGELLSGRLPELGQVLALHERVLRDEVAQRQKALSLLAAARRKLGRHGNLSSDDLIALTQETIMTEPRHKDMAEAYDAIAAKHLTADDRATLEANGFQGMAEPDDGWARLYAEAEALMQTGDAAAPAAMDLARRWMSKVFESTGGDRALTTKMKAVAREVHETPPFQAAAPSANRVMDFVTEAYGAAIAAGLMPRP